MFSNCIAVLATILAATAKSQIEDQDFDAAQALETYGVDASKLRLDGLREHTLESSCTIAVCPERQTISLF